MKCSIHICYITPAGCTCTCGWSISAIHTRRALSDGYGHVAPHLNNTTTMLVDLTGPAKEFFRNQNQKDGVDK